MDSSFLVALYCQEVGSTQARAIRHGCNDRAWLTPLHWVEWEHALARKRRVGELSAGQAHAVRRQLLDDLDARVWTERDLPASVMGEATSLARRFGERLPMRTLDTLHVACALVVAAAEFWTLDRDQAGLATMSRLPVRP